MLHPNIFKTALTLGTLAELDLEILPDETIQNISAWADILARKFPELTALEIPDFTWYLGESWAGVSELTLEPPPADFNPDWVSDILSAFKNPGSDRTVPDDFFSADNSWAKQ